MSFLDHEFPAHLLWIVPLFLFFLWYASAQRKKLLSLLFSDSKQAESFLSVSKTKRVLRNVFLLLAISCTVLAAARPSWGHKIMPNAGRGHDLLVVFDVSKSMLADDVKPTRLEHAKWLVRELVKLNPADRFGLIAFAGKSMLQCPLTIDKTSFLQIVDDLNTDTIAYGGTNLQDALQTAVRAFDGAEGNHKAVLLITDGDELTGHASQVVDQLAAAQIPIIAAGIGDPSNPAIIRLPDEKGNMRILTDAEGNTVKSPLNETQLAQLATKTGGMYVRSVAADAGISEIQAKINGLDRREGSDGLQLKRPIERPASLIAAALVFLAAFLILSEKKASSNPARNSAFLTPFVLFGLLFLSGTASAQALTEPAQPQPEKEPVQAAEEASAQKELTAEALFNLGLKAQKEDKDPAQATQYYEKAISAGNNPAVRTGAYQNLGVIGHTDAQKDFASAKEILQKQDLDGAEKKLDESLKKLTASEELYRESLRDAAQASVRGPVRNQQQLQKDRKEIEELKKKIEELKKQQQQAQQQTQQARDQQKKENQQQDQQQKQDQQNAQQQTQQAKDAAEKLENQAKELNQKDLQDAAQKAKDELQKAAQEQQKNQTQKAQEHLEKAAEALNDRQKKDQQKKEQESREQGKQNQQQKPDDQQEQQSKDEQKQEDSPAPVKSAPQADDRKIDPKQAEALLDVMAQDEKELRDLLKEQQKKSAPAGKVQKDW